MNPDTDPITIFGQRVLDDGTIGIDAIVADGRRVTATVPRWNSTAEGIDRILRASWRALIESDAAKVAVLASYAADERDPYAMDDPDTDAATR